MKKELNIYLKNISFNITQTNLRFINIKKEIISINFSYD